MELITETYDADIKILIISETNSPFIELLKTQLQATNVEVFTSIGGTQAYMKYDVIFFVNYPHVLPSEFLPHEDKKVIYVFFNYKDTQTIEEFSSFSSENNFQNVKVIRLQTLPDFFKKDVETILWFSFSRTSDTFLHIYHEEKKIFKKKKKRTFRLPHVSLNSLTKPKILISIGIMLILITQLMFIPPLALASLFHYYSAKNVLKRDMVTSNRYLQAADSSLQTAKSLFEFPKPVLHFFSIALFPEDVIQINTSVNTSLHTIHELDSTGREFADLLSIKNKTDEERNILYNHKEKIFKMVTDLQNELIYLEAKIPTWNEQFAQIKNQLGDINASLLHVQELTPHIDTIFGRDEEKKYLLMFGNNMELRPGGGFIGSFAIVTMRDYSITDMRVYDVYDADGQLTEQIDPPDPIVDYLNQTHWFLRDSAFSPDFVDNYAEAKRFLELELNETDFDGGIFLTTTAVQNVLASMDGLYIPDYKETITNDNFYIKAQTYAEDQFFPGSQQKKRFLASVMNQMLIDLPQASFVDLLEMTEKSLNEKQIVFYMEDPIVQAFVEENYWSGRTLTPKCNREDAYNCVLDYVFPFDANLGVNKANYYIQRPTSLDIQVDDRGDITNTLTIDYKNSSFTDIFPGGRYKNYFQTYLPPNTRIRSITIDGVEVDEYDETNFEYKTIGFLVEVPPQDSKRIKIEYTLPTTIISGEGVYQLIFQKQIGSPNYDFQVSFTFPDSITVQNRNFTPLVKDNKIIYNTSISSDKIFVIEFTKN